MKEIITNYIYLQICSSCSMITVSFLNHKKHSAEKTNFKILKIDFKIYIHKCIYLFINYSLIYNFNFNINFIENIYFIHKNDYYLYNKKNYN